MRRANCDDELGNLRETKARERQDYVFTKWKENNKKGRQKKMECFCGIIGKVNVGWRGKVGYAWNWCSSITKAKYSHITQCKLDVMIRQGKWILVRERWMISKCIICVKEGGLLLFELEFCFKKSIDLKVYYMNLSVVTFFFLNCLRRRS